MGHLNLTKASIEKVLEVELSLVHPKPLEAKAVSNLLLKVKQKRIFQKRKRRSLKSPLKS